VSQILLVDDDPIFTETTGKILEKLGHSCTAANSVEEARGLLQRNFYDLLMLDIMLPDGSGIQVLDACGDQQRNAHVALITGHPSVKSLIKTLYGSNISYLVKPFDLAQLKQLLACGRRPFS
jgi:two-component system, NtrC family, response regulator HydG